MLLATVLAGAWCAWRTDWGDFGAARPPSPPEKYAEEVGRIVELRVNDADLLSGQSITLQAGARLAFKGVAVVDFSKFAIDAQEASGRRRSPEERRRDQRKLEGRPSLSIAVSFRRWSSQPPGWKEEGSQGDGQSRPVDTESRLGFTTTQEAPVRPGVYELQVVSTQFNWSNVDPQWKFDPLFSMHVTVRE